MSTNTSSATNTFPPDEWRRLAEAASKEMNTGKLMDIIDELCGVLDKGDSKRKAGLGGATT